MERGICSTVGNCRLVRNIIIKMLKNVSKNIKVVICTCIANLGSEEMSSRIRIRQCSGTLVKYESSKCWISFIRCGAPLPRPGRPRPAPRHAGQWNGSSPRAVTSQVATRTLLLGSCSAWRHVHAPRRLTLRYLNNPRWYLESTTLTQSYPTFCHKL